MVDEENLKQEIADLTSECERLRSQRDAYKSDLDRYRGGIDDAVSAQLQLLSARLSQEIREGFFSALKRVGWVLGIFVAVATAGGLVTVSDVITARIDDAVKEREEDVARLRDGVIQAVVDFKLEAETALKEIAKQRAEVAERAGQARLEITSRVSGLTVGIGSPPSLQVAATAEPGADVTVWFGELSRRAIGVAGSRADQFGYEVFRDGESRGAFSYHFIRSLKDFKSDVNKDGQVSMAEALIASRTSLAVEKFEQEPVIAGEGESVSLFSTNPLRESDRSEGTLRVVLIGINKYATAGGDLRGPVNDVMAFRVALSDSARLFAKNVQIRSLTDEEATLSAIKDAVNWLTSRAISDDISLLYYSGHVSTVLVPDPTGKLVDGAPRDKAIMPHDGDWNAARFIRVPELAKSLSKSKGRFVLVIDG